MSLYSTNSPKWPSSSASNDYNNSHNCSNGNKHSTFNDRPNNPKRICTEDSHSYRRSNFSSPPRPLHSLLDDEASISRPRPSLSERLGLKNDDSDENEDESTPYSPSHPITKNSQSLSVPSLSSSSFVNDPKQEPIHSSLNDRIIRNPQLSLLESTLSVSSVDRKSIMDLLGDHTSEDEEEGTADDENQPYSPSQLDSTTMEQVSHQLRIKPSQQHSQQQVYVPSSTHSSVTPLSTVNSTNNTTVTNGALHQSEVNNDIDYREPTTSNSNTRHHHHNRHHHHKHHQKKNDETHENQNSQNKLSSSTSTDLVPSPQQHHHQLSKRTSATHQTPLTFHGLPMISSAADEPRQIPIHGEAPVVDPRIKIYSNRLKSKVRQLCLERLEQSKSNSDRAQLFDELDTLVECHGKRLYWYRVICFLQNIQTQPKACSSYIRELNKLLILTPTLSKLLKVKQRYPKKIPIDDVSPLVDPRINSSFYLKPQSILMKSLQYDSLDVDKPILDSEDIQSQPYMQQPQQHPNENDDSENDMNENDFDQEEMDIEEEEEEREGDQNDEE